MQYVTTFERIGMERGLQQGIQQGFLQGMQQGISQGRKFGLLEQSRFAVIDVLNVRFGAISSATLAWLLRCGDLMALNTLHRQAVTIPSLAEFEALLRQMPASSDAPHGVFD